MDTEEINRRATLIGLDWTHLADVCLFAQSIGPGHSVFRDQGSKNYGICESKLLPNAVNDTGMYNPTPTTIWDTDDKGAEIEGSRKHIHAVLGKSVKRHVIYRVK